MKKYKIKAFFTNGFSIVEIQGKNLGDAFYKYYMMEYKALRYVTGFELHPQSINIS